MPHVRIQVYTYASCAVYTYQYVPTLHFPMTVCAMPSPFATRFIAVWIASPEYPPSFTSVYIRNQMSDDITAK